MSDRLAQVRSHLALPSISAGPTDSVLLNITLGDQLRSSALHHPNRPAVISYWQKRCLTYLELDRHSDVLARALLANSINRGDRVAILAGNCVEYVLFFYAAVKIGAICVVLNPAYTEVELTHALKAVGVKLLVISVSIGPRSLEQHIDEVKKKASTPIILLAKPGERIEEDCLTFDALIDQGNTRKDDLKVVTLDQHDVVNIQFTSGTTGAPKASCLTHHNLLNNGRFVGRQMALTPDDILCVPVPLFHCFGLVLANMAAFTHHSSVVYPCEIFQPRAVLETVQAHKCTVLHGVPTMFIAILELMDRESFQTRSLRTGIAAGTVVNAGLMTRIQKTLGLTDLCITYGQTETSPASTMTSITDAMDKRTTTVGKVLPHTTVKVVDKEGRIVPRGVTGEVCTAGYLLHRGYWDNAVASEDILSMNENGETFLKTGDMGCMDQDGYLRIPGRLKDLIIRGGENISPSSIENELAAHTSISDVSVVAISDERYGEVVGAFIIIAAGKPILTSEEVRQFAKSRGLAHYKIPVHIFIMGQEGISPDFPKTMSGKIQKYILRRWGDDLVKRRRERSQQVC